MSFFDYLSPFCSLLIEFHYTFSISYKILPYHVYYHVLYFDEDMIGRRNFFCSCPLYFFTCSRLSSYHLHLSLSLMSLLLFPCSSVWENTRA